MAHIDLSSAKACPLCSFLVTKDGLISGEAPVSECPREACPLRKADEERRAKAAAARAATAARRERRRTESRQRRKAIFERLRDWWQRWRQRKTPEGKVSRLQREGEQMRLRREGVAAELAALHDSIRLRKAEFEAADAAKQARMKPELQLLLRRNRHKQRELEIHFENEAAIEMAVGRLRETVAYGRGAVTESEVDAIAIDLEDAAGNADQLAAAIADLESAGRRQSSLLDQEIDSGQSFDELLAPFDEEESVTDEKILEKPEPADLYREAGDEDRRAPEDPMAEPPRRLEDPE